MPKTRTSPVRFAWETADIEVPLKDECAGSAVEAQAGARGVLEKRGGWSIDSPHGLNVDWPQAVCLSSLEAVDMEGWAQESSWTTKMIQDILPQGDDPAGAMLESIKGNTIHYGERVIIMAVAVEAPDDAPKVKTVKPVKKASSRIERERGISVAIKFELATSSQNEHNQYYIISSSFYSRWKSTRHFQLVALKQFCARNGLSLVSSHHLPFPPLPPWSPLSLRFPLMSRLILLLCRALKALNSVVQSSHLMLSWCTSSGVSLGSYYWDLGRLGASGVWKFSSKASTLGWGIISP
ncbi:hypothetical protein B0H14DRAFT_2645055 [Mycena olivaceomarginata]|nr:hypothetical protein B0H14DRAFT_2645055 [Mycena olivaceomarginata]